MKNAFAEFSALCERKNSDLNGIAAASTKQLTELVTVIAEKELSSMEDDFAVMVEEVRPRVKHESYKINPPPCRCPPIIRRASSEISRM